MYVRRRFSQPLSPTNPPIIIFCNSTATFRQHVDISKCHRLRRLQVNTTRFFPPRSNYMDPETAFATHGIITTILANLPRTAPLEYIAFGARAMGPKNEALWSRIGYLAERVEFLR